MTASLLIADADAELASSLATRFSTDGYRTVVAHDGHEALRLARDTWPDLVLLDLGLRGLGGNDVCRELKQDPRTEHVPVLALGRQATEIDRVVAFELGVTDFVDKPFSERELALRVRAILRRSGRRRDPDRMSAGSLVLDAPGRSVTVDERMVDLTAREFEVLQVLMRGRGRVFSRDELLAKVWGEDVTVFDRVVDVCVMRLRRKLGTASDRVETVRGVGYRVARDDD